MDELQVLIPLRNLTFLHFLSFLNTERAQGTWLNTCIIHPTSYIVIITFASSKDIAEVTRLISGDWYVIYPRPMYGKFHKCAWFPFSRSLSVIISVNTTIRNMIPLTHFIHLWNHQYHQLTVTITQREIPKVSGKEMKSCQGRFVIQMQCVPAIQLDNSKSAVCWVRWVSVHN